MSTAVSPPDVRCEAVSPPVSEYASDASLASPFLPPLACFWERHGIERKGHGIEKEPEASGSQTNPRVPFSSTTAVLSMPYHHHLLYALLARSTFPMACFGVCALCPMCCMSMCCMPCLLLPCLLAAPSLWPASKHGIEQPCTWPAFPEQDLGVCPVSLPHT